MGALSPQVLDAACDASGSNLFLEYDINVFLILHARFDNCVQRSVNLDLLDPRVADLAETAAEGVRGIDHVTLWATVSDRVSKLGEREDRISLHRQLRDPPGTALAPC